MTKPKKTLEQLAEEHWRWLEALLYQQRLVEKRLFIDAFVYGYKHGKEERNRSSSS